jgi:CelD/BcsL family acetyltransferase involved in cellulose biosynthesis
LIQIRTVDTRAAFIDLRDEWDAVLAASRQDNPFLMHEWLSAWWDSFGGDDELAIQTCRDEGDGRLLGVLPLYRKRTGRLLKMRVLRFLGDTGVGSVRLTAFALPDVEARAFEAFAEHLRENASEWDVLDLLVMKPEGAFFGVISQPPKRGSVRIDADWHAVPRIALPADWDAYLGTLTTHMRGEVRRRRRKMEAAGASVEIIEDAAAIPGALEDLVRIYVGRMRHTVSPDYSVSEATDAFFRRTMEWMLSEGGLRLRFLVMDGHRLAFTWQFRHADTVYNLMTAFDDERGKQDVATVLLSYGIESAIDEGCPVFDMLLGAQPYKLQWNATEIDSLSDLHVYSGTPAGMLRRDQDAAVASARRVVEAGPERLREPVKRFARSARDRMRGER